jgi:hypothetical protein
VDPEAGLDELAKRKNLGPCWESNPCHPTSDLVTISQIYDIQFRKHFVYIFDAALSHHFAFWKWLLL